MTKKERGFFFIKEPSCLLINGKNTIERNKYKVMNISWIVRGVLECESRMVNWERLRRLDSFLFVRSLYKPKLIRELS